MAAAAFRCLDTGAIVLSARVHDSFDRVAWLAARNLFLFSLGRRDDVKKMLKIENLFPPSGGESSCGSQVKKDATLLFSGCRNWAICHFV